MADPSHLQQELQGMSLGSTPQPAHYPAVPQPAPGYNAAPTGYPAAGPHGAQGPAYPPASNGYPAAGTYPPSSSNGGAAVPHAHSGPVAVGAGWTPDAVQPEHASKPGQSAGSHYGHLQYAPSFNTAALNSAAAAGAAVAAVDGASSSSGWVLTGKLPQAPTAQLIGPHVRFNDHDPVTGTTALSVLVVANPSLSSSTVQLHWAVNGPAMTPAPCQLLDEFMGYKFHRFDISVQLQEGPAQLNYLVGLVGGQAPMASHTIHLPARSQPWRWIAYSCNGFHEEEPEAKYGGIANLWRDVLSRHTEQPYHLQLGGGDQIYCDHVMELPSLKPWLAVDDPQERAKVPFTPELLKEMEQFYFGHYAEHFLEPNFASALASIPFHFSWDDHDIFDGWGSYPDYVQQAAVFQGMFAVARRFYLLFQQHCRYDNATTISKTMGEYSYHMVRNIGPNVILMSPDTRSERTKHQVVPPAAWDMLMREVEGRLAARPGAVQHVIVLLPVPIVYPKIPVTESVLASISTAMATRKGVRDWMSKISLPSGALSAFNEPDLLDDLLDHWTASDHVQERQSLVRRLQGVAESYSVRVTFFSGDVHVGAFGCFQAHPKQPIRVADPKFMLQVISSAIGNEPPPGGVLTALETTSMACTTMVDTLDKMIRAFPNRSKLRGARNYCEVTVIGDTTCELTGAPQPPGGLSFTLRVEAGPPGKPTGIETFTQVAPVLLAGPRASEVQPYMVPINAPAPSGVLGSVLPAETAKQVQAGIKTMGHRMANFLARV